MGSSKVKPDGGKKASSKPTSSSQTQPKQGLAAPKALPTSIKQKIDKKASADKKPKEDRPIDKLTPTTAKENSKEDKKHQNGKRPSDPTTSKSKPIETGSERKKPTPAVPGSESNKSKPSGTGSGSKAPKPAATESGRKTSNPVVAGSESKSIPSATKGDPVAKKKSTAPLPPSANSQSNRQSSSHTPNGKQVIQPKKNSNPPPKPAADSDSDSSSEEDDSDSSVEKSKLSTIKPAPTAGKSGGLVKSNLVDDQSSDSDSDSSDSDSADEQTVATSLNGKPSGHNKTAESSDDSTSSSDEDEQQATSTQVKPRSPKPAAKPAVNGKTAPSAQDSDDSSSDSSESSSSDEETPKTTESKKESRKSAIDEDEDSSESESDEDEDSSDSESDEDEIPTPSTLADAAPPAGHAATVASKKRKNDGEIPSPKKSKPASVVEDVKSVFVGGLSWNVDDGWLKSEFESCGTVVSARVITERGTQRSKGFGYVDFETCDAASQAVKTKNGTELDGRTLKVDFSTPREPNNHAPNGSRPERKSFSHGELSEPSQTLFIGSLPYSINQDALWETFAEFGDVSSVRVPTDPETQQVKGFAYVEFTALEAAKAAVEKGRSEGIFFDNRQARIDFSTPRVGANDRGGFGGRGGFGSRGGRGGFGDRGGRGRGGRGRGGGDQGWGSRAKVNGSVVESAGTKKKFDS